ncbi:MAG: diphthamide biosynthesis enzyme Dph2 [Euryarchaeota archaeon]|nr:diphthamide biosynthesis enzyme Dph2 [Euryarchaeota archaeon]
MYAYDLSPAVEAIRQRRARVAGLEMPEGLKGKALEIARTLEEQTGATVVLSGEACWGACDLNTLLRERVDVMVHLGHSPMVAREGWVYVPVSLRGEVEPLVREAARRMQGKRVAVVTTVQHLDQMAQIEAALRAEGKEPLAGEPRGRIRAPGQMLGCDYSQARPDADEILFVGSGDFHPLGAAMAARRPIWVADLFQGQVRALDIEALLEERKKQVKRAMGAREWGILFCTKVGQARLGLSRQLQTRARAKGLGASIIAMDEVSPLKLANFHKVQAWVNTACPRLALDDGPRWEKPMLTPQEFEIVLGERTWENYEFDEMAGRYDMEKSNYAEKGNGER